MSGVELWKSEGTAAGTVLVNDSYAGAASSSPQSLLNVAGTLYFSAASDFAGRTLWQSDGTQPGTQQVGSSLGSVIEPTSLTNVGSQLWFSSGDQLWRSDGTLSGTFSFTTGITGTTSFDIPQPLHVWDPGNPLLTTPHTIPTTLLPLTTVPYTDNGDRLGVA